MNTLNICAYWNKRPLSGAEYADQMVAYITALELLSPAFVGMYVLGKSKSDTRKIGAPISSNEASLIMGTQSSERRYVSVEGAEIPMGPHAHTKSVFMNTFTSTLDYDEDGVMIESAMGSLDPGTICRVILRMRGEQFNSDNLYRRAFDHAIDFWRPAYAYADFQNVGEPPIEDDSSMDEIPLGWLTYLCGKEVIALNVSDVNISAYNSGGIIEIPGGCDAKRSEAYWRRLISVRKELRAHGLSVDPLDADAV